jgi:hypothetical protein
MSIRDRYAELGVDVSMLDDIQLEGVTLDILAEFGELHPSVEQLEAIVRRHAEKSVPHEQAYEPPVPYKAILDFEAENHQWWRKARLIRERFAITTTRYSQLLNRAIDDPDAIRYAPVLTARLARLRDSRRQTRSGRRGTA